ncbi:putative Integral membrane protein [Paratrimastix pyriformis]|uniref:Integral membrane protein n=1 Tax=Paratrimastix pyriformis TaxID=342808 RepID=A0ABQ8U8X7_9EUKA|nr:putative Integral membrane protein [Paratrimastix pyriformis]
MNLGLFGAKRRRSIDPSIKGPQRGNSDIHKNLSVNAVVSVLFVLSGTAITLVSKALYGIMAPGANGEAHHFAKPWFSNWAMIQASVWQMLRGSIIVFTALLAVLVRRERVAAHRWVGVALVVGAEALVGCAAFLQPSVHPSLSAARVGPGIGLVVFAQLLYACQNIIEDALLHPTGRRVAAPPPALVVAWEGLWGFLLCSAVAFPVAAALPGEEGTGLHEDTWDTFVMLFSSGLVAGLVAVYVICIFCFNLTGMLLIRLTGALTRNMVEPLRALLIWLVGLLLHAATTGRAGEAWTRWSWLQLVRRPPLSPS